MIKGHSCLQIILISYLQLRKFLIEIAVLGRKPQAVNGEETHRQQKTESQEFNFNYKMAIWQFDNYRQRALTLS